VVHELRKSDPKREVVFAISDFLEAHADPVLMRVALSNLLGNAWKYTGRRPQALIFSRTVRCVSREAHRPRRSIEPSQRFWACLRQCMQSPCTGNRDHD
jgi:signal transduction histidine kinase